MGAHAVVLCVAVVMTVRLVWGLNGTRPRIDKPQSGPKERWDIPLLVGMVLFVVVYLFMLLSGQRSIEPRQPTEILFRAWMQCRPDLRYPSRSRLQSRAIESAAWNDNYLAPLSSAPSSWSFFIPPASERSDQGVGQSSCGKLGEAVRVAASRFSAIHSMPLVNRGPAHPGHIRTAAKGRSLRGARQSVRVRRASAGNVEPRPRAPRAC